MSVSFCLPHPVAVSAFMICRGSCACTEMLWMCVLFVSFGSKVRPRTFGCVAMGSALLFIVRSLHSSLACQLHYLNHILLMHCIHPNHTSLVPHTSIAATLSAYMHHSHRILIRNRKIAQYYYINYQCYIHNKRK